MNKLLKITIKILTTVSAVYGLYLFWILMGQTPSVLLITLIALMQAPILIFIWCL